MIDLNKEKQPISKKAILEYYQDIDIYRRYIQEEIDVGGKPILSPLRKEKTPSFGFFIGERNEICFKDFKLDAKGDFVTFVMLKFGLTYWEALSKIGVDFDLCDDFSCKPFEKTVFENLDRVYPSREELLSKTSVNKIGKRKRQWQAHDILYWQQFGISVSTLEHFDVEPISHIFIGDKIYVADKHAYAFLEMKDNKETYKIYQPFNEKYKWINGHNDSVWQGWTKLPSTSPWLIITKSLKDVMSLYEVCGISAVALQSENILPKRHVFEQIREKFPYVTVLYDNDFDSETNWGKIFGNKIATELGIVECYLDDHYKCKDFSDLVKKYGKEKAKEILEHNTLLPF